MLSHEGHCCSHSQVILIENKEESLDKARVRGQELGLANLRLIQANLDYFTGPFHIGVSNHGHGPLQQNKPSNTERTTIAEAEVESPYPRRMSRVCVQVNAT